LSPASSSSRRLIERFAAHLAHLLNGPGDAFELRAFALFRQLLQSLSGDNYRKLTGFGIGGDTRSSEEAAQWYFDAVLERRLFLARANDTHKGHELLLALCRRGSNPHWLQAGIRRQRDPDGDEQPKDDDRPSDFPGVAERLSLLDKSVSAGNPAEKTREQRGPLRLIVGAGQAEVAEEVSIWKAITCAPTRLVPLRSGREFNEFCSLVIKAVEAANAPYGAFIGVGLSPFDWQGEISINTLKKLSAFLTEVRVILRSNVAQEGSDNPDLGTGGLETWRVAWARRPVPGFGSADALWRSEVGRALRVPQVARKIETVDINEIPDDAFPEQSETLDAEAFLDRLKHCGAAGLIDDFDLWLYQEIWAGSSLADLAGSPRSRSRFSGNVDQLALYVEELTERVLAGVQRHLDPGEGSHHHPDRDDDPEGKERGQSP
jgi:hypothetical protein